MKIERTEKPKVIKSLKSFPVVAILGPRQVGKTTLAKSIAADIGGKSVYLDLENPADYTKLTDPVLYLKDNADKLVIIDEIQLKPELFPILRSMVDENGAFYPSYSELTQPESKYYDSYAYGTSWNDFAGRIKYHELTPFSVFEVGMENISELWIRGGFPDAYLAATLDDSFDWIAAFVQTFLERDLGMLGFRLSPHNMRRVWTMLAHYHGAVVNYSALSNSLDVSNVTVKHWIDVLEDTYMLRTLRPWSGNTKKRMVKSPKIYLRDSGILHNLLGVEEMEKLLSNPILGASWEGFIIEQIAATAPDRSQFSFYRNSSGNEVDMIVETPKSGTIAFEIKRSLSPSLSNGTYSALKDISPDKAYVIYSGDDSYRLNEDVTVIPVAGIPSAFEK